MLLLLFVGRATTSNWVNRIGISKRSFNRAANIRISTVSADCRNTFNFRPGYEITRSPWAKGLLNSIHEVRIVRVQISKREHIGTRHDTAVFSSYGFASSFDYQIYNRTTPLFAISIYMQLPLRLFLKKREKKFELI